MPQTGVTATVPPATTGDAPGIREIYAPFVVGTAVSFEEDPPSVAAVRERVADTTERFPWLVRVGDGATDDGAVLGYAYAHPHRGRGAYRWSVDSSVYVAADARRGGVATGLCESLFDLLRIQGFRNVSAGTALPNPASTGFHEAMGFEPVGTYERVGDERGEWRDVRWWHRSLGEYPAEPDDPTDANELRGTDEWAAATRVARRRWMRERPARRRSTGPTSRRRHRPSTAGGSRPARTGREGGPRFRR